MLAALNLSRFKSDFFFQNQLVYLFPKRSPALIVDLTEAVYGVYDFGLPRPNPGGQQEYVLILSYQGNTARRPKPGLCPVPDRLVMKDTVSQFSYFLKTIYDDLLLS